MTTSATLSLWTLARRSFLLWVGMPFLILGLVFLTIGVQASLEEHAYRTQGLTVEAVMPDKSIVKADRQQNPRTQYVISYRFTPAQGETITGSAEVPVEEWERLEAGRTFTVTYLPGDPASSRPPGGDDWIAALVFSLVGGVFTLLGAGLVFEDGRRLVRAARVLRRGIPTEGTVVRTEPTNASINRVTQWQIRYRYRDHVGRAQEGVSPLVSPEEALEWKESDHGIVRFDRERPEISLWLGRP